MYELEVPGQEKAREYLLKAFQSGKVSHAFLFVGPPGTGKSEMALWFAALLTCASPAASPAAPCGTCASCRKIRTSNHPDVRVVKPDEKTLNIRIEEIRGLQRDANFQPIESARKVFIVQNAHRLLDGAANCFLKVLEEPPSHTVMLLTSVTLHALLPTIVSRCQVVKFAPLDREHLAEHLISREGLPPEKALVIAHISQGSAGRARELAGREGLWETRKKVLELCAAATSLSARDVAISVDGLSKGQEEYELVLEFTLGWLRDLLVVKEKAGEAGLINIDMEKRLEDQASQLTIWQITEGIALVKEAYEQLRMQVNPLYVLERMFLSFNRAAQGAESWK
ncbi:MAG: DNA polymerase III subunit delta' [Candidatus Eremiobacteraeota bacterium]|nr:DNA polymerase III subunit delta' [Candidatus Eremiobacteraeota bacterium]